MPLAVLLMRQQGRAMQHRAAWTANPAITSTWPQRKGVLEQVLWNSIYSRIAVPVSVLASPVPIQLHAQAPGKAANDGSTTQAPVTCVGHPAGLPGSRFQWPIGE